MVLRLWNVFIMSVSDKAAGDSATLPIQLVRDQLIAALGQAGRLIVTAETGSGKTTQLPQILPKHGINGTILVLEPRRLAARLVARRVAGEMGTQLGELVGFRTRFESAWSANTRIGFVTEGVFLRMLLADPQLRGVGAVIVDEFHERSLQADMAISAVAQLQQKRGDLAFVVMSATLDAQSLAKALDAQHVHASGRNFPIDIQYRRELAAILNVDWKIATACMHMLRVKRLGQRLRVQCGAHDNKG